jgi:hypothetical protein
MNDSDDDGKSLALSRYSKVTTTTLDRCCVWDYNNLSLLAVRPLSVSIPDSFGTHWDIDIYSPRGALRTTQRTALTFSQRPLGRSEKGLALV